MSSLRLLIRPTLFTAGVCGACFCGAAIVQYENRRTIFPKRLVVMQDWITAQRQHSDLKQKYLNLRKKVSNYVNQLSTSEKLAGGAIFINFLVLCGWRIERLQPVMIKYFLSQTSGPKILLSPMILSCFSHSAPLHFAFNMFALYSFSRVATSFLGPEQLVGVYLSAGAVSSLTSIANRLITSKSIPSLGASGALLGVIAYVCVKSPDAQLLLFFFPILAGNAIKAMMALDCIGMIAKWRLFDHAAHLGGSLFGVWYATYGERLFHQHRRSVVEKWVELKRKYE